MQTRTTPLSIPPARAPYFTVVAAGATVYLRSPSLLAVGPLLLAVSDEHRERLVLVVSMLEQGRTVTGVLAQAPEILALFGAWVGLAWADPVLALETPKWTEGDPVPYGTAVYEELYEAGWSLAQVVGAAVAIAKEVQAASSLDAEVREQAGFFLPRRAATTVSASTSSGPTLAESPSPS